MSRASQKDFDQTRSRYAQYNNEKSKVKTRKDGVSMPSSYDKYKNVGEITKTDTTLKSKYPLRGERYNLRQKQADPVESQSQGDRFSARKTKYKFPPLTPQDLDDSVKKYNDNTTNIKESSNYLQERPAMSFSSSRPHRRSRSAHSYGRDTSPLYKQTRTENTSPKSMESLDDSMDHFLSAKSSDSSFLPVRNTQKYSSSAVSQDLQNLHLKRGYDLDGNLKVSQSNKLQIQKMDFKQESIYLSRNWVFLLSKYYDEFLEILKNKLKENIDLYLNQNIASFRCVQVNLVKRLLENDLTIIELDSSQQSWLNTEVRKWKNLIDVLQGAFFCAIFNEEDFSKAYVCTTKEDSEFILSNISEFLDESSTDVKISLHVKEFMMHNKKFSHLKTEETAQDGIWIRNIRKPLLLALKEEIRNVICRSYLLDENQYELLFEMENNILSNIENKFQVKGSLYQLPIVGDTPAVFQLNPLISICCFVNSDPENIPVDSLINVDWLAPQSTSDVPLGAYECSNWKSSQRSFVQMLEADIADEDWTQHFIDCFAKIFSENIPPATVGINFPLTHFHFKEICVRLLGALQMLWGKSLLSIQCYVILIVPEDNMKSLAENILRSQAGKNPRSPHKHLSEPMSQTNSLVVKVVQGNLADQQVDVIVNSTNHSLNLKYGKISSSLLKKAGSALQKECAKKYPKGITYPECAITHGHKLLCKYVIHGALPLNSTDMVIKDFVYDCLIFTVDQNLSSIAFPALGTGTLNYPASHVVQQIDDAFKMFERLQLKRSLPEVRIVLYSEDMELKVFYKLDNSQKSISKTDMIQAQSNENHPHSMNSIQTHSNENHPHSMNWIQFVNYSCVAENLALAISVLEEDLKKTSSSIVKISVEEFEEVFFFKDLHSVIPNIVQQLDNKKDNFYHLKLSPETKEKLKTVMLEVKQTIQQEHLHIIQPVSSTVLDLCLLKTKQVYPQVKFIVTNNGQSVIIQSLDWNLAQEAKYFLEVWLGIKFAFSVSKDRFNQNKDLTTNNATTSFSLPAEIQETQSRFNKSYQEDNVTVSPSSTQRHPKNRVSIPNSPKNQEMCCLQTENGLIIKVYQGDILNVNVEGIVNAANRWLRHGGGLARAIIRAAGDAVNIEGQQKLNGGILNDGEVLTTSAGNLRQYKYIIHAVGPMYTASKNDDYCFSKIAMAVNNTLQEANILNLKSIALPALSSAIFGVPMDICTQGYYAGVRMFSKKHPNSCLKEVHFVDKNDFCVKTIQNFFKSYFIVIDEESTNQNDRQSPKNLSQPSPPLKEASASSSPTQNCFICMERMKNPAMLNKCKHVFCTECISQSMKDNPKCPQCKMPYGIETGNQPPGTMLCSKMRYSLPGYEINNTFEIKYEIKNPFNQGLTIHEAFLPATEEGIVVLKMLQLAFERRLIFTIRESRITSAQNVITWNDIHHKTKISGGPLKSGYPDLAYIERVTQELADHGITANDVADRTIQQFVKTP